MKEKTPIDHESASLTKLYRAAVILFTLSTLYATGVEMFNHNTPKGDQLLWAAIALSYASLGVAVLTHNKLPSPSSSPSESPEPNLKS